SRSLSTRKFTAGGVSLRRLLLHCGAAMAAAGNSRNNSSVAVGARGGRVRAGVGMGGILWGGGGGGTRIEAHRKRPGGVHGRTGALQHAAAWVRVRRPR